MDLGVEIAHGAVEGDDRQKIDVSPVAILVLSVTCLVFFVLYTAVSFYFPHGEGVVLYCPLPSARPQ
jgi:hypothetical protein